MLHLDDALTLLDRADDAAAADVLGTLAVETPVHATVHVLLAQACERLHRWDDALSAWQTARLLLPDLALVQQGTLRAAQVLAALQTLRAPEPFPSGDDDVDDRSFGADDFDTGSRTYEAAPDDRPEAPTSAVFVDDPRGRTGQTAATAWGADAAASDPYAALRHSSSVPPAPPMPTVGAAGAMGAGGVGAPPIPDPQADPYAPANPSQPQAAASRVADPYRDDPYASPILDPYAAPHAASPAAPPLPVADAPPRSASAEDAPRATPEAERAGTAAPPLSVFFDPLADAIHARPLDDPRPAAPRPPVAPPPPAPVAPAAPVPVAPALVTLPADRFVSPASPATEPTGPASPVTPVPVAPAMDPIRRDGTAGEDARADGGAGGLARAIRPEPTGRAAGDGAGVDLGACPALPRTRAAAAVRGRPRVVAPDDARAVA